MKLTWLGHSSLKLEIGSKTIFIDPYAGSEEDYYPCELVLISQWSFDHCKMSCVRKAIGDKTHVLGTKEAATNIFPCGELRVGERRIFDNIEIVGVESFNERPIFRGETKTSMLGFLIKAEGKTIYFMGDSDFFKELTDLKPDLLLIAVGGTYTMTPEEAAKAEDLIAPKLSIPIHWGSLEGTRDNAELYKELVEQEGGFVKILEPESSTEI
ncbi:hypothetical protein DRJ22_01090 [Candidatus Woesearchaeota archaeon]|nr:MAG: hypothetical protein DRJ22_01090 [Candidatus Woesearchaeota archaeon]